MSRIPVPATDRIQAASLPLLNAVRKDLGTVPNLMKMLATSPAALGGYLRLNAALAGGSLGAKTGERIALAVAEINGCGYCLAAHTYLGKHVAGLDDDEMKSNRAGRSSDARAEAALRFATIVATERGHVSNVALREVQDAGFDDGEVMEIVAHVALNTLTNYVNEVAQTDVDFPAVDRAIAA
jgi:uncharacterized peroxidase-related enzyme